MKLIYEHVLFTRKQQEESEQNSKMIVLEESK